MWVTCWHLTLFVSFLEVIWQWYYNQLIVIMSLLCSYCLLVGYIYFSSCFTLKLTGYIRRLCQESINRNKIEDKGSASGKSGTLGNNFNGWKFPLGKQFMTKKIDDKKENAKDSDVYRLHFAFLTQYLILFVRMSFKR